MRLTFISQKQQEAPQQLNEKIAPPCDILMHESNNNLTQGAIELRGLLKSDIVKVEQI